MNAILQKFLNPHERVICYAIAFKPFISQDSTNAEQFSYPTPVAHF